MGRKKPRIIPKQNAKLCRTICLCQLTMILSCVAGVYLTLAIYIPSYRAFNSELLPDPVMCQTIQTFNSSNCSWASCNEWCLTSTSGYCPQVFAIVRRSASNVIFENCTSISKSSCPMVENKQLRRSNCNNGSICEDITGMFNCSKGICYQWNELFLCNHVADGEKVNAVKDNVKLNGFFQCHKSICVKIKKPFHCDRYCGNITTDSRNVILMEEDTVITANCIRVVSLTESQGDQERLDIEPTPFWNNTMKDHILITNCMNITKINHYTLGGEDCLNGTLIESNLVPSEMNFTQFWKIYRNSSILVDPTEKYLPNQQTITIYNSTKIYINLEACVNTLRNECKEWVDMNGRDGRNDTAQSRYPCYYNKNSSELAVTRFNLKTTYRELLIAAIIPSVLFVISFTFLCIFTHSVRVGDDSRMRCKYCTDGNADSDDGFISSRNNRKNATDNEPILSPSGLQSPYEKEPGTTRELMGTASSQGYDSDTDIRTDFMTKSVTAGSRLGEDKPLVVF